MAVLDDRCGRGFASLGLARLVGENSPVISTDLQREMVGRRAVGERLSGCIRTQSSPRTGLSHLVLENHTNHNLTVWDSCVCLLTLGVCSKIQSMLSDKVNYIVSGLERSGTSLMMQMLEQGGMPVTFDDSRPPDEHNPRGYFELAGGKIISQLEKGTFDFNPHRGRIIKITAYGLKFMPEGNYKVIYMLRNIDEVLISMNKMGGVTDMEKDKVLFDKLNRFSLALLARRDDMDYITVNYNDIVADPGEAARKVDRFLGGGLDIEKAAGSIDLKLYRSRVE